VSSKRASLAFEASQRLEAIPGIGVIGATAIVATVADPTIFRSGRDFAAWIGLVPLPRSFEPRPA
jgi:transposase